MKSLKDLDVNECRWPIGDPQEENFGFCGKKKKRDDSYCEEHKKIAYQERIKYAQSTD